MARSAWTKAKYPDDKIDPNSGKVPDKSDNKDTGDSNTKKPDVEQPDDNSGGSDGVIVIILVALAIALVGAIIYFSIKK